jgi:type I restriction enzyme, S subunit
VSIPYPLVPLGEVMDLSIDAVAVDPAASYPISGVYSFGRGLFAREPLTGSETTYKVFHRLHANDFVLSKLKAWEGALAKIPASFDGWFLSPQFSTFRTNQKRLDISYVAWYCRQSRVWDALRIKSRGMGARRDSVSPKTFLALEIPLPEQRRIVVRIEELAARIEEARGLRRQAAEEAGALWTAAAQELFAEPDGQGVPLRELVTVRGGGTPSKKDSTLWGGEIPWVSPKDMKSREIERSIDYITKRATHESSAKLVDPGAVLVVVRGMILAHTVPSAILRVPATINQDMKALVPNASVLPEYLCNAFWAQNRQILALVEKSSHDTRKLQTPALLNFRLRTPSLSEQRRIVAYLNDLRAKIDTLKQLQAETAAELVALLPSVLDQAFKGKL